MVYIPGNGTGNLCSPEDMGKKAAGGTVACVWYAKVHSAPYTYDQGGQADREDPKCAPLLWFFNP
jgi:hypothetical protein